MYMTRSIRLNLKCRPWWILSGGFHLFQLRAHHAPQRTGLFSEHLNLYSMFKCTDLTIRLMVSISHVACVRLLDFELLI